MSEYITNDRQYVWKAFMSYLSSGKAEQILFCEG